MPPLSSGIPEIPLKNGCFHTCHCFWEIVLPVPLLTIFL
uniref:Uncharacterized protein n=1 Tax=Arundo donax TaxID=35708 RepID=A0A0A8YK25_ARUDO